MNLTIKYSLLILFSFSVLHVLGQDFPFKTYTIENGLPSSKIYDILQDKKGYVWFASDYGASRFDGESFTNFNVNDRLASNTIVQIAMNEDGLIYFLNANGQINVFNQSFSSLKANESIKTKLQDEIADHFSVSAGQIHLTTTSGKHFLIKENQAYHINPSTENISCFYFLPQKQTYIWGQCFQSSNRKQLNSIIKRNGDTIFIKLENEYKESQLFHLIQLILKIMTDYYPSITSCI